MKNISLAALLLVVTACGPSASTTSSTSSVPTPPPSEPTASAPSTSEAAPTAAPKPEVVGNWSSPECAERKYERKISLAADGSFASQDLVSPCPPNAKCVWSGIVDRKGTWSLTGEEVTLSATEQGKPAGSPLPSKLQVDKGALVEVSGNTRCTYVKQ
ncbi:MAG: hypothetical protein HOW73_37300 [Polyangiaceae bacterium]|nr:hypothetical protein [Polyangiaceae bacterium]